MLLLAALVARRGRASRPAVLGVVGRRLARARFRRSRRRSTALLPQSWLGGGATHKGVLYGARHDLLPVGAYFLGRGLALTDRERTRLCTVIVLGRGGGVAPSGCSTSTPCRSRAGGTPAGWFSDQLGLDYKGLSGLPENFVYNAGDGVVFRRLTSTFLSPLATAYLLVVAMFFIPFRRRWGPPLALLLFAALLWTHTRAALLALVVGLLAARGRAPARAAARARGRRRRARTRFRQGLRPLRAAHALHAGRARHPGADREGASHRVQRRDQRERVVDERAPREPARRRAHRRAPSVGLRARQRRRDRRAHARHGQGGRVDLHRARGRDRPARRRSSSSRGRSSLLRGLLRRQAWLGAAFAAVLCSACRPT